MHRYSKSYYNLILELTRAQFKIKDQSTFFGLIWSFLNPILMLSILLVVFQLKMGQEIEHYAVYLLVGIIQYSHFSNTTGNCVSILSNMGDLSSNVIFPKEAIVIGSVLADVFEFVVSIFFCLLIGWAMGISYSWALLFLPVLVVLQIIFSLWVSLFLSVAYLYVRDIRHVYQVLLRVLFFITPIFYDISMVGEGIGKVIIHLNPLTYLIQYGRTIIIAGAIPDFKMIAIFFIVNILLLQLGLLWFRKLESTFAEYL